MCGPSSADLCHATHTHFENPPTSSVSDFPYTKISARPRSHFIYTRNFARPGSDFIYTNLWLCRIIYFAWADVDENADSQNGKMGMQGRIFCGLYVVHDFA